MGGERYSRLGGQPGRGRLPWPRWALGAGRVCGAASQHGGGAVLRWPRSRRPLLGAAPGHRGAHADRVARGASVAATGPLSAPRLERQARGADPRRRRGQRGMGLRRRLRSGAVRLHAQPAARILASNTKLFTTATALDRLGADRRLETGERRGRAGCRARRRRRPIDGDLYLVGDGDPALGSPSASRGATTSPVTPLEDLAAEVREGRDQARGGQAAGGRLASSTADGGTRVSGGITARTSGRSPGSPTTPASAHGDPRSTPAVAASSAASARQARRSRLAGSPRPGALRELREDATAGERPLADARAARSTRRTRPRTTSSPRCCSSDSTPATAQHGTTKGGAAPGRGVRSPSSAARSTRVDGSGLSAPNTRLAAHRSASCSLGMLERPAGEGASRRSLPVAGREGTLRHRMRGTAAEGRCRGEDGHVHRRQRAFRLLPRRATTRSCSRS